MELKNVKKKPGKPKLYCIVGKSGSGKNFYCESLGLTNLPSYTTRAKRPGEKNGLEHVFVSMFDWEKTRKDPFFKLNIVAWTEFHNNFYWTLLSDVVNPKYDAFIVDPKGIDEMIAYTQKNKIERDIYVIYINTNLFTRFWRMVKRDVLKKHFSMWPSGIKNVCSRIKHDSSIFSDFKKKYKVDYVING